jgi:iron complex outermembrane recepter protein
VLLTLLVALVTFRSPAALARPVAVQPFQLEGDSLADLLQQFALQSGMQLLFVHEQVSSVRVQGFNARLAPAQALRRLLHGTGLSWSQVNEQTIAIFAPGPTDSAAVSPSASALVPALGSHDRVAQLLDVDIREHSPWQGEEQSTAGGQVRSLYDTPRSVSVISTKLIDDFSLSAVEDLLAAVPGVFTTTRFGVQGSVDVRGVPADTYFRGMKRLTLQGHARSVLGALDSVEVVAGPASTLYGLGKLGGYTNVFPRSGRASSGRYMEHSEGFLQMVGGRYGRREVSGGFGGPLPGPRAGGYYIYGAREDSDSFTEGVPVRQTVVQVATSIADAVAGMRLDAGIQLHESQTAGALVGRLTQDLVSDNRYIRGMPLVDLDQNHNGRIGYLEMVAASPVRGLLSAANQPLNQLFAWPKDRSGKYLALENFPQQPGVPLALYDYLLAHPEADPTGQLRAQGIGGPLPLSGSVPVGMFLDPRSVGYASLPRRRSAAFERLLKAQFITAYLDFARDDNPDAALRNQLFFDGMNQRKSSNQPFSQEQHVWLIEDKLTASRQLWSGLHGTRARLQATANARYTKSSGRFTTADYGNHRSDATADTWSPAGGAVAANTTFSSSNEHPALTDDGLPWGSIYFTRHLEIGAGMQLDFGLGERLDILLGARHDVSDARNTQEAGRFNFNTGSTAQPGEFVRSDETAAGWDSGTSLSLSLTGDITAHLRPYITLSRASLLLDGNNNSLLNSVIRAGHVGTGMLREVGIRSRWHDGRLNANAAIFRQGRVEVEAGDDPSVLNAYATATTSRGWQVEAQYAPDAGGVVRAYVVHNVTRYTPNVGAALQVDARALGFVDVVDLAGNVIYPAEAFLYGGRARLLLPADLTQYSLKQGNPPLQAGLSVARQFGKYWQVTARTVYLSSTCTGRLCLVTLPHSFVADVGAQYSMRHTDFKLDIFNMTDRRYFRARTGDTLGDVIAQSMPGRRWQLTARHRF